MVSAPKLKFRAKLYGQLNCESTPHEVKRQVLSSYTRRSFRLTDSQWLKLYALVQESRLIQHQNRHFSKYILLFCLSSPLTIQISSFFFIRLILSPSEEKKVRHMYIYYITVIQFQNSINYTTIKEFYISNDRHQMYNKTIPNIKEICCFEEKNLRDFVVKKKIFRN